MPLFYKQDIDKRKHQINTLKIFNDNVTEITEDSEYEVSFLSGENSLIIKISLGSDFPKEKPVLAVSPTVLHPWVNEKGIVTAAPGLLNFTEHSDLGRVVQAIIREFQRTPPSLAADGDVRTSPSFTANFSFSPPSHGVTLNTNKSLIMQPPLYQSLVIPELNQLTLKELRFLEENEDRQAEFIDNLPFVKDQSRVLDDLMDNIEELAEENLEKQLKVKQLEEAVDLKIEEVAKLAFDNERLYSVYQDFADNFSPRNIQEKLGTAAKKAEEDSEKIAESFLQGDLDVDKFLNLFIKSKSLCQLRKSKEEKLCHQLDRLEKAGF